VKCKQIRAQLVEYVASELTPGVDTISLYPEIESHLETCSECQARYFDEFHNQGIQKTQAELQALARDPSLSALDLIERARQQEE
jgi:hypothetical protein